MANESQNRILALAVFEMRVLLSAFLGSTNPGSIETRRAAHLSYALHNQALAIMEGRTFDVSQALESVSGVDTMLGSDFLARFASIAQSSTPPTP